VLSIANQFLLLNCVVCSKLVFAAEFCLSATNQFFTVELCSVQRKLCCHQRIGFRCRILESAMNQFSLPHCGVNNKSFSLSNCGVSSEFIFAAKLWSHQRTSFAGVLHSSESVCW